MPADADGGRRSNGTSPPGSRVLPQLEAQFIRPMSSKAQVELLAPLPNQMDPVAPLDAELMWVTMYEVGYHAQYTIRLCHTEAQRVGDDGSLRPSMGFST